MKRTILLSAILCIATGLFADTVSYKYDDAGRLISVAYPNGAVISYTYDRASNLTSRTVTAPASAEAAKTVSASNHSAGPQAPSTKKLR